MSQLKENKIHFIKSTFLEYKIKISRTLDFIHNSDYSLPSYLVFRILSLLNSLDILTRQPGHITVSSHIFLIHHFPCPRTTWKEVTVDQWYVHRINSG